MRDLLTIAAILAIAFASTFLVFERSGLITETGISLWLARLQAIHPGWVMATVVVLLLLDMLIAVPTMVTILLAGFLLGPVLGGVASALGLMALGGAGYLLGHRYGRPVLHRVYKDPARLAGIETAFARNDLAVLFCCQALPILPELSCVLAGISRMPLRRFLLGYGVGVVPYAFILAYGGAISAPDNLTPAILTATGGSLTLLLCWRLLARRKA